jgi:hypothetical protein
MIVNGNGRPASFRTSQPRLSVCVLSSVWGTRFEKAQALVELTEHRDGPDDAIAAAV